jgi:hypothetical protein
MLGDLLPVLQRRLIRPIADSDPKPGFVTGAFNPDISRLTCSKFNHPLCHLAVSLVIVMTLCGENDRIIWRFGQGGRNVTYQNSRKKDRAFGPVC